MRRIRSRWEPPPKLSTTEWANRFRYLAPESSALPGKYSTDLTPWVPHILESLDDPSVWKVVCRKSAQIAWTDGVLNNWLGRIIDIDPSPVIGLFAKDDSAREYAQEKFAPMVTATPRLSDKIDVTTSRKDGNRAKFKKFDGGFLKLVGSNSPGNVKSTPSPRAFVEEPDDASSNVGKQGDSIKLLEERTKTYHRRKVIFGGTPSIKDISAIDAEYLSSDQREFWVPCHECGEAHVLDWANVVWDEDETKSHAIYKQALPETARYVCPHCGAVWDDRQKQRNVQRLFWRARAEFRGVAGWAINELYSPFPGSRLSRLVERCLEAQYALDNGDESERIVFVNSALGLPYAYETDAPEREQLEEKALDYPELEVPRGGLVITAGVDVQHDRLAVVLRAWGRDEESWLVYWGEIYGNTIDPADAVWDDLDSLVFSPIKHAAGFHLPVETITIDSSDGTTQDAVYKWTRRHKGRGVMAGKGSSDDYGRREIYSKPKPPNDPKAPRSTKASRFGLRVYVIGTQAAKDLLSTRMKLTGQGAGRMHWYRGVRADYYDQMLGEIKAPSGNQRKRLVWQKKSGARVEAWDCEVYALHAARAARVHTRRPEHWDAIEARLRQEELFAPEPAPANREPPRVEAEQQPAQRKTGKFRINRL